MATRSGDRFLVQSPQRRSALAGFGQGKSPPNRDPGLGPSARSHQPQLSREIQKVQKELLVYIEKVKNRGNNSNDFLVKVFCSGPAAVAELKGFALSFLSCLGQI